MAGRLRKELKQSRPFGSPREEALLNILKTAAVLQDTESEVLKPYAISPTQYNVLRILRGAGKDGLRCQEIAERMIARDPDVTRLLDRLVKGGLISRTRSAGDRRVVISRITEKGNRLLAKLDPVVRRLPDRVLGKLSNREAGDLIVLMEKIRAEG